MFDSFFSVLIFKKHMFKSCALFGKHTLLDQLLRVLQLPTHLSDLSANGY